MRGLPGEVYQLCSGRAVSVGKIIEHLTKAVAGPIDVQIDSAKARTGESPAHWADPRKASSETGWEPQYDLQQTLNDLTAYWQARLQEGAVRESGDVA